MYNYPYGDNQQINLNWIISEIIALHQRLDPDYTAPTFTQIYPFSDTQQLNLDWILTELKALKELAPTPSPTEEIDEVGQALIAGAYDADTQYQKNDYIVQDGKVYRANAATTGTFDPTKWREVMLGNDLAIITRWADATNTYLNNLAASNVSNDSAVAGDTVKDALGNLNGAVNNEKNELNAIQNIIIFDQGGIGDTTGLDADSAARVRTRGFLPPYFTITIAQPTTYDIRVKGTYYYDENNNFIRYLERNTYSVTVDSTTNPNKYKVRLSFWSNDREQAITPSDLILANYQVTDGIQTQIDNLNGAISNVQGQITANIQTSTTASKAYTQGEFLALNGVLYRVTQNISNGGTITVGTNVEALPIGDAVAKVFLFKAEELNIDLQAGISIVPLTAQAVDPPGYKYMFSVTTNGSTADVRNHVAMIGLTPNHSLISIYTDIAVSGTLSLRHYFAKEKLTAQTN